MNSTDSDRLTALHLASQEGCVDCVKLLLEHDADVAALSRHGDTALSLAAKYGQSLSHTVTELQPRAACRLCLFCIYNTLYIVVDVDAASVSSVADTVSVVVVVLLLLL